MMNHHSGKHFEIVCNLLPFMSTVDINKITTHHNYSHFNNNGYGKNDCRHFSFDSKTDNLLYCIYLLLQNSKSTNIINSHFSDETLTLFQLLTNIKTHTIDLCKKDNGLLLKPIKMTCKNFTNHLFSCDKVDWSLFYGICAYNQIIIVVQRNNILYYFGNVTYNSDNEHTPTNIDGTIHYSDNLHHIYFDISENVANPHSTAAATNEPCFFHVYNPFKPMKASSSYKIKDLQAICNQLNIATHENSKPKLKNVLYNEICQNVPALE